MLRFGNFVAPRIHSTAVDMEVLCINLLTEERTGIKSTMVFRQENWAGSQLLQLIGPLVHPLQKGVRGLVQLLTPFDGRRLALPVTTTVLKAGTYIPVVAVGAVPSQVMVMGLLCAVMTA
jgi:hypothetical protein